MVKYNYDAWGNWINKETLGKNSLGNELVNINPIIYKGYIYDEETDFYYLKSRYYSPKIRRFINVDSEIALIAELENSNLFAYCSNNPINLIDENGNWPSKWWQWIIGAIAVIAVVAVVVSTGETAGMVLGAFLGTTANLISQGISNIIKKKGFFDEIDVFPVLMSELAGAVFASSLGIGSMIFTGVASEMGKSAMNGETFEEVVSSGLLGGFSVILANNAKNIISSYFHGFRGGMGPATKLSSKNVMEMARVDGPGLFKSSVIGAIHCNLRATYIPLIAGGITRGVVKKLKSIWVHIWK